MHIHFLSFPTTTACHGVAPAQCQAEHAPFAAWCAHCPLPGCHAQVQGQRRGDLDNAVNNERFLLNETHLPDVTEKIITGSLTETRLRYIVGRTCVCLPCGSYCAVWGVRLCACVPVCTHIRHCTTSGVPGVLHQQYAAVRTAHATHR
jgi:hypothetical protein